MKVPSMRTDDSNRLKSELLRLQELVDARVEMLGQQGRKVAPFDWDQQDSSDSRQVFAEMQHPEIGEPAPRVPVSTASGPGHEGPTDETYYPEGRKASFKADTGGPYNRASHEGDPVGPTAAKPFGQKTSGKMSLMETVVLVISLGLIASVFAYVLLWPGY